MPVSASRNAGNGDGVKDGVGERRSKRSAAGEEFEATCPSEVDISDSEVEMVQVWKEEQLLALRVINSALDPGPCQSTKFLVGRAGVSSPLF